MRTGLATLALLSLTVARSPGAWQGVTVRTESRVTKAPAPTVTGRPLWGVDVSAYQHPRGAGIDWAKVAAAGYTFAAIKATEGNSYLNPYYFSDVAAARAAGLYVTAYHFALPDMSGGASQARAFVANSGYRAGTGILPPELDIEYNPAARDPSPVAGDSSCYGLSPAQLVSWIAAYDTELQRLTGQLPIIFTGQYWWDACTADSTAFGSRLLWVAANALTSPLRSFPPLPAGWGDWVLWRYTGSRQVPGIHGDTDVSEYNPDPVIVVDPGGQRSSLDAQVSLRMSSLNGAAGQSLTYMASGLPSGLAITGSGRITGTVLADPGTYHVTVTATNSVGAVGTASFTWAVSNPAESTGSRPAEPASQLRAQVDEPGRPGHVRRPGILRLPAGRFGRAVPWAPDPFRRTRLAAG